MRFFLDTASIDDIKFWQPYGVVNGVTTNPKLLSNEDEDPLIRLKKITSIVNGPVSAEVTYNTHNEMISQGKGFSKISDNIVVKVPATTEGILAAKELVENEIACNVTLTFDPSQAIPFCTLPVNYVSLILGRIEDFGQRDDLERTIQLRNIIDQLQSTTKLLSASIRNSAQLKSAIIGKSDVVTIPPNTWMNIYQNSHTLLGEKDFLEAWKTLPKTLREEYETI